jgi:hypothetical protein
VLISYDTDYPEPLRAARPVPDAFGVALVLAPQPGARALARVAVGFTDEAPARMAEQALERLRQSIPAARSLPLLQSIARGGAARVVVDYIEDMRLGVEVTPCS